MKSKQFLSVLMLVALCVVTSAVAAEPTPAPQKVPGVDEASDAVKSVLPKSLEWLATTSFLGVEIWRLAAVLAIVIAVFIINALLRSYLKRKGDREDAEEGKKSFLGLLMQCLQRPLRIIVWGIAVRLIGPILMPIHGASAVWMSELMLSIALAVFIYEFVDLAEYYLKQYAEGTDTKIDDMLVPVLRKALRVLVVIVASLHIYQSVTDKPVATLLAGLGIGGLAFALAAQDTIKNVFGFVMIAVDRPFVVGERISFDGHDGVVEAVGLRSTKLRRLDGHLVSIPNAKAADSVIHNIARRPFIKRAISITITYDTPLDKVQRAIDIVKELLDNHEGMNPEFPPRVYFSDLNADSLNILALYWYHPPEYWNYMAFSEKFNFELMRRYEEEGIEFAFPTQTIYLAGDSNRELKVGIEKMIEK